MSSGACRALVALLLTLVAAMVMALPAVAKVDALDEESLVRYYVKPASGTIDVRVVITFATLGQDAYRSKEDWGPIIVEERPSRLSVSKPFKAVDGSPLPGPWKELWLEMPKTIEGGGESRKVTLNYTVRAQPDRDGANLARTPARVDESYFYFCAVGQDADKGSVSVRIDDAKQWKVTQSGTKMEPTDNGFRSTTNQSRRPGEIFTCFEGTRDGKLETDTFVGPADRRVELQAWAKDRGWLVAAERKANPALDEIHRFLTHDIPGNGSVMIREAPERGIGGYASAHDTPGVVQLDERGGTAQPEHELAHAWFGTDNFTELWLREAMADWTATSMSGQTCAPAGANSMGLELSDWQVVQPTSREDHESVIAAQERAACGIVSAMAERMPPALWLEVIGSMLTGETKYIGSAGPEIGVSSVVDFREWLDAVDERGLVPAAADPAYADNLSDLDFAQDLLEEYGIPSSTPELEDRSKARAYYHQFLADSPVGAPKVVRKAMDDWRFADATAALDTAYEVLTALTEADELLPTTELIPIIQPRFEAATNEDELKAVADETFDLLEGATNVFEPLGDLQSALPLGWKMPAAVQSAIAEQRFDDIMTAITPAIAAAQEISGAHTALPDAGLLDKYQVRYENTTTPGRLDELAGVAAKEREEAERAGLALGLLNNEAGDWQIPPAVTEAIEQGQIRPATLIIEDARAIIAAAKAADLALPQAGLRAEMQPRFEAIETAADMAVLREEAEARRIEAEAVGNARSTINTLVPTWEEPSVLADAIADGDFKLAAQVAPVAQKWIRSAWQADQDLPDIGAMETIKASFEGAGSLAELEEGAELAEDWAEAAAKVKLAKTEAEKPRDMLTSFGLWGIDVQPTLQAAIDAAIAGDVAEAIARSGEVLSVLDGGASSGGLRLAGLVFFGVAVLGVLGLWIMLRRQAGPSWARSSTPHWVENGGKRGLLGRGRKKED